MALPSSRVRPWCSHRSSRWTVPPEKHDNCSKRAQGVRGEAGLKGGCPALHLPAQRWECGCEACGDVTVQVKFKDLQSLQGGQRQRACSTVTEATA